MKPRRRWPRLSRLAAFAGLVRWLLFGGPAGCTMALGDYAIRDATADCWLVYDAIDERAEECGLTWRGELHCSAVLAESAAPSECIGAIRSCECADIVATWDQNCQLFREVPR